VSIQHPDGLVALFSELYEINCRVECGDIASAKAAIASTRMKKLLTHYEEALWEDGVEPLKLEAFVAAGGWVGLIYSYRYPADGFTVTNSVTPRRVQDA
jgi:hypothetical protein